MEKSCRNPLCVQSHNVILMVNKYFAEKPNGTINCEEFMELQYQVWQRVKKELGDENKKA